MMQHKGTLLWRLSAVKAQRTRLEGYEISSSLTKLHRHLALLYMDTVDSCLQPKNVAFIRH